MQGNRPGYRCAEGAPISIRPHRYSSFFVADLSFSVQYSRAGRTTYAPFAAGVCVEDGGGSAVEAGVNWSAEIPDRAAGFVHHPVAIPFGGCSRSVTWFVRDDLAWCARRGGRTGRISTWRLLGVRAVDADVPLTRPWRFGRSNCGRLIERFRGTSNRPPATQISCCRLTIVSECNLRHVSVIRERVSYSGYWRVHY